MAKAHETTGSAASGFSGAQALAPVDLSRFLPAIVQRLWSSIAIGRSVAVAPDLTLRTREWRVLMVLASHGPMTNAQVAKLTGMDSGMTARAVGMLLEAGLLIARVSPEDRRKQDLALSEAGAQAHDIVAPIRKAFSDAVLSCLDEAEKDQLFALLARVQERAEALTEIDSGEKGD